MYLTVTLLEQVAKPDETVADNDIQESSAAIAAASATGVVEEESAVEQPTERENVIDQIKRSPLGKFFNKKKEVEHKEVEPKEEVTEVAPVVEEPQVAVEEPAGKFSIYFLNYFIHEITCGVTHCDK